MLYESRFDAERFSVNPSPPSGGIKGGRQLHRGVRVITSRCNGDYIEVYLCFAHGQKKIGPCYNES